MATLKRQMTQEDAVMIFRLSGIDFDSVGWAGVAQRITTMTFHMADDLAKENDQTLAMYYGDKAQRMLSKLDESGVINDAEMTAEDFVKWFDSERSFDVFGWVGVVRCIGLYYQYLSKTTGVLVPERKNMYKQMSHKLYWLIELFEEN